MDEMNVAKISRMQRELRWQAHLPFMPVNLPSHPWASRYDYKYDTLPIVQLATGLWTLEYTVLQQWWSHVNFFTRIIRVWRNWMAMTHMGITYPHNIVDWDIQSSFPTEKKARAFFWHYRTLVFQMFAEFSFIVAGKPQWKDSLDAYIKEKDMQPPDKAWLDRVETVLCDFLSTKRAGVIVKVETTELWPFIGRYHDCGVPILMDVGYVEFHDNDETPSMPKIVIPVIRNPAYRAEWPSAHSILKITEKYIWYIYPQWLGQSKIVAPLNVARPRVLEPGGVIQDMPETNAWGDVDTDQPMRVAAPQATKTRSTGLSWVEFLERRREVNRRLEEKETPVQRQRRESLAKDALKINQSRYSGPSKKSIVYVWEEEGSEEGVTMQDGSVSGWRRKRVNKSEVESTWEDFTPSQRLFDPFHNEWDLCTLLDADAQAPDFQDPFEEDEDVDMYSAPAPVSSTQTVAFLDQLNLDNPVGQPYSDIRLLASNIKILAPKNLPVWAYQTFGFSCPSPADDPDRVFMGYSYAAKLIGFVIEESEMQFRESFYFQEFIYFIVSRAMDNPRFLELTDLNPSHRRFLQVGNGGIDVQRVNVLHSLLLHGTRGTYLHKDVERIGYIIKPLNDVSGFVPTWVLCIYEATTVVQIIRNGWGSASMEELVRELVQLGVEFNTLVPSTKPLPEEIVEFNKAPPSFSLMEGIKPTYDTQDYTDYVRTRNDIITSPHGRAAFRSGGILWRLAMQSLGNLNDIVDALLDGPMDLGPTRGEYFTLNGGRYYDYVVPPQIADTICGTYGLLGGT